ncbi:YunC family protein [Pontibacillus salipaludis]|uniref:DUF1805 domain-containing protein n=1 Tax=Pontibacillus salipaludis TaxID=1697394 RepID=A0ABQ1PXP7_9BACI|nr:DUF1805 domain-containing protein [Pontibacillus salipaludis]GGD06722.1 hypothetical protein GCM10011389_12840 [Pontibacillus salipaludis]
MVTVEPVWIEGVPFTAVSVVLPKTNLLVVTHEKGYIMCGALDVDLLNEKLADRNIVAGRAVGVRSIQDLLEAPLEKVTIGSKAFGWEEGMIGKEAMLRLVREGS